MTESDLWKELNELMLFGWTASRHEDILTRGVPDVSFSISSNVSGWIELKCKFTILKNGGIKVPTLEPAQRVWLHKRAEKCGHVFVLCANENAWFFIRSAYSSFLYAHKGVSPHAVTKIERKDLTQKAVKKILEKVWY